MNRSPPRPTTSSDAQIDRRFRLGVTWVLLPWLSFGVLWILVSDMVVQILFQPEPSVHIAQSFKGLVFVGISCLLILVLLRRFVGAMRNQEASHLQEAQRLEGDALREARRAEELADSIRALVTHSPTALLLMDESGTVHQSSTRARALLHILEGAEPSLTTLVVEADLLQRSLRDAVAHGSARSPRLSTIGCRADRIRITFTHMALPQTPPSAPSATLLALLDDETEEERFEGIERQIRRIEESDPSHPLTTHRLTPLVAQLQELLDAARVSLSVPSPSALQPLVLQSGPLPDSWPDLASLGTTEGLDPTLDGWRSGDNQAGILRLSIPTPEGTALLVLEPTAKALASPDFAATLVQLGQRLGRCFTRLQISSLAWIQATALSHVNHGILLTNRNGRILWCNPGFEQMSGWTLEAIRGERVALLNAGMQNSAFYSNLWKTVLAGQTWSGELYNRRRDGSVYLEEQTIHPVRAGGDEVSHFVASKVDLTPMREREDQIRQLERSDFLTGLLNRKGFEEAVRALHGELSNLPTAPLLLLLDLDAFLAVNQAHGTARGDAVLREVGATLAQTAGPDGSVARLEADAFAVLLPAGAETLDEIAHGYLERIAVLRIDTGTATVHLTASIGAVPLNAALPFSQTLALAESAMLAASAQGGHRVVVMKDEADRPQHALEAATWRPILENALTESRFRLVLQDVVDLELGQTHHFEVLLRLQSKDGEFIPPGQFFPIAERLGMAPRLDAWVVESTLLLLDRQPELRVFINLSGRSLGSEPDLDCLTARLMRHPELLHRITFEITETAAIQEIGAATRWMQELRRHGVRFALDDFGVGTSNFAYLRLLPIDFLKIDGSFVRGVEHDVSQAQIIAAIVGIARALDLRVIAEHVEEKSTMEKLRSLGVDFGQGWYFNKPRTMDEISKVSLYSSTRTA